MEKDKAKTLAVVLIIVAIIAAIGACVLFYHSYVAFDNAKLASDLMQHSYSFYDALGYAAGSSRLEDKAKAFLACGIFSTLVAIGSAAYSVVLFKRIEGDKNQ